MKAGWEVKTVEEIADSCLGKMLDKRKNQGTPRPYLRNLNVRWFEFDLSDLLEMKFEDHEIDRYTAQKGDVMICEGGYPGRAAIWDQDETIYFQKAIHRVRFHEPERAKWFLYYIWMCDADGSLSDHFTGSGIQHFTGKALKKFAIPLPPLEEQQRIVAVLDEAFDGLARARAHAEANLQNARELTGGSLDAMFESLSAATPSEELQDVCTERGITYGVIKLGDHDPDGVPCLRTSNVRSLRIDVEGMRVISPILSAEYRRTVLEGGEVLVNVRGTLGGVAPVPEHMAGWNISREVAMVPVDRTRIDPDFASYFISTRKAQAWLTGVIKGAAYKGINLKDLRKLLVPLPSLEEQREVVSEIVRLRTQCLTVDEACNYKIQDIDDLRQSLLQKAFAGELI